MTIIKRPKLWIIISLIYIWLYSIGVFIAAVGPPLIIANVLTNKNDKISMQKIEKGFVLYAQEASKTLNVKYSCFLYTLFLNIILMLPTLAMGIFTLQKKLCAKNGLIGLLLLYILCPILIALVTSEYNAIINFNTLSFIPIIIILTRKTIDQSFTEQAIQPD